MKKRNKTNLRKKDRIKGGVRSEMMQNRDAEGKFEGKKLRYLLLGDAEDATLKN